MDFVKQHYVPQSYLKKFKYRDKDQIYVLERLKPSFRISNVNDICEERNFYKIDIQQFINLPHDDKRYIDLDKSCQADFNKHLFELNEKEIKNIEYFLEALYSKDVENNLNNLSNKIIARATLRNSLLNNKHPFIDDKEKEEMSYYLINEFLRTKHTRDVVSNMNKQAYENIVPILAELQGISPASVSIKIKEDKQYRKAAHIGFINQAFDTNYLVSAIHNGIWVLIDNVTDEPFATNDRGLSMVPTEKVPPYMGYGLASYGMVLLYPLNKRFMLSILERNKFHSLYYDKSYNVTNNLEHIENLNFHILINSYQYTFFSNYEQTKKYYDLCLQDSDFRTPLGLGKVG